MDRAHVTSNIRAGETRSPERLAHHYAVERELADRLRQASSEERSRLYAELYDELFSRVPDHPGLTRQVSESETRAQVEQQLRFLRPLLRPDSCYLEIGAGDCALSLEVARHVKHVTAVEVSREIVKRVQPPANMRIVITDGREIPAEAGSVDLVYSNQVMEHLHPDDAAEQLRNIYRALRPGGVYVCITPNRLNGPHDVSRYFDSVATGFHLKEYSAGELGRIFRAAGFSQVKQYVGVKGRYLGLPLLPVAMAEGALSRLPAGLRRRLTAGPAGAFIPGIRLVARK